MQTYHQDPKSAQRSLYYGPSRGRQKTYCGGFSQSFGGKKGATVTFLHFPTLASDMRASIRDNSTQANLDKVKQVDVLMLDDIWAPSPIHQAGCRRDLGHYSRVPYAGIASDFFTSTTLSKIRRSLIYNKKALALARQGVSWSRFVT